MISYHPATYDDTKPWQYFKNWQIEISPEIDVTARAVMKYVWSPIAWRGGHRREKNFLRADYLVLDFDTPDMSLADAVKSFCDTKHIIGTTRNHQKEKNGKPACDRFRVVIKFEAPIKDIYTYRHTLEHALKNYPADAQCIDGARYMFPCTEIISSSDEGFSADVHQLPHPVEYYLEQEKRKEAYYSAVAAERRKYKLLPPWAQRTIDSPIFKGERNLTVYKVSKDLFKSGYDEGEVFAIIFGLNFEGGLDSELKKSLIPTIESAKRKCQEEVDFIPGK